MKTIKGPGVFLAQFMREEAPYNTLENITTWLAGLGYKGIQIPTWDNRCIDLEKVAESKTYAEEYKGRLNEKGLTLTELSAHLQSQLVASHPTYDKMFDGFAPEIHRNNVAERTAWAIRQMELTIKAAANLGLKTVVGFSGALLWHTVYPWPQRPSGLVDAGFTELAKRWMPLLDFCDNHDVDLAFELHAGEDLHDGVTYERFLEKVNNHKRAKLMFDPSHLLIQQIDYLEFIDIYHDHIKAFHVKDAEFLKSGRSGIYGGYQDWADRPGKFRSLGDGQVDFKGIFSRLSKHGFDGWAVLEWECYIKNSVQGATEGAKFIQDHIIQVTDKAFDDFAGGKQDDDLNREILGLNAH